MEQNESVTVLNVESNFLSGEFLSKLMKSLLKNQTVVELHAENQVQSVLYHENENYSILIWYILHQRAAVLGHKIEMEITESIEQNETLLRLGLTFQSMEARHRVSDALERNLEKSTDATLQKTKWSICNVLYFSSFEANWRPSVDVC